MTMTRYVGGAGSVLVRTPVLSRTCGLGGKAGAGEFGGGAQMGFDGCGREGDVAGEHGVEQRQVLLADVASAAGALGGTVPVELCLVEEALAELEQDGVRATAHEGGVEPACAFIHSGSSADSACARPTGSIWPSPPTLR